MIGHYIHVTLVWFGLVLVLVVSSSFQLKIFYVVFSLMFLFFFGFFVHFHIFRIRRAFLVLYIFETFRHYVGIISEETHLDYEKDLSKWKCLVILLVFGFWSHSIGYLFICLDGLPLLSNISSFNLGNVLFMKRIINFGEHEIFVW